jgi:Lysyl oxidase
VIGRLALLLLAAALVLPSAAASPGAAHQLLPDLVTRKPYKIFLQVTPRGKHLIRFSNEVVNVGAGPLELRPRANDCDGDGNVDNDRTSYQRVYRDTNGDGAFTRGVDVRFRERRAGCSRFHPAHKHWHVEALAAHTLGNLPAGPALLAGKKVSSCVLDARRRLPKAASSPRRKYYRSCRRDSIGGISIGWGDVYGARITGQELDVTALLDGDYCLLSYADPENRLLESNERNNVRSTRIVLRGDSVQWQPYQRCPTEKPAWSGRVSR